MISSVNHVPLFTIGSIKNFFINKKPRDYQVPLIVSGCFLLIAKELQNVAPYNWSGRDIIDFGKGASELDNIPGYWEGGASLRYFKDSCVNLIFGNQEEGGVSEGGVAKLARQLTSVVIPLFHAMSSGSVFLSTLNSVDAIQGLPIREIKFMGGLGGIIYFTAAIYKSFQSLKEAPEDLHLLNSQEAKAIYQQQDRYKKFFKIAAATSILFLKFGAFNSVLGQAYAIQALLKWQNAFGLTFFASWTMSYIGVHLFNEQMTEFKNKNQT